MGNGPPWLDGIYQDFPWGFFIGLVFGGGYLWWMKTLISLAWFCLSSEAHGSCNSSQEWMFPSNKIAIQISRQKKSYQKKTVRQKNAVFRVFLRRTSLKVWVGFQPNFKDPSHQPTPFGHPTPLNPAIRRKKIHPHGWSTSNPRMVRTLTRIFTWFWTCESL